VHSIALYQCHLISTCFVFLFGAPPLGCDSGLQLWIAIRDSS